MAAVCNKWEVVGKGGKKRPPGERKKAKVKSSDIPKAAENNILGDTKTMFQALKSKENRPENGHVHNNHHHEGEVSSHLDGTKREQSRKPQPKAKKRTDPAKPSKSEQDLLQEALQEVDVGILEAMLSNLELRFPNDPLIWLQDLSSFIQLKLNKVPQDDPVFEGKPKDYPMCLLPKPVKDFYLGVLKKITTPTQERFYKHCLKNVVSELKKGQSAYGDQIMVQCIVQVNPGIMLSSLEEYKRMVITSKSQPREALALMWSLGQLPKLDLKQGLKVWLEVMMPLLGTKQLAKFSVDYLDFVLDDCVPDSNAIYMNPKEFLAFLDVMFTSDTSLGNNRSSKQALLQLYPKIKKLSVTANPQTKGRLFFPPLLKLLSTDLPSDYEGEVLSCLVLCLEKDQECFNQWTKLYPENLEQSSCLLSHLVKSQGTKSGKVSSRFSQAVKSFQQFNNQMGQKEKGKAGLDECVKACDALAEEKKGSSCCSRLFKLLVVLLIGFVTYDVYKHKSYEASKTGRFLKEYGIEQTAVEAAGCARESLSDANSWIQAKYPTYHAKAKEYLDPAWEFTREKLGIAGTFVAEQTKPARDYLNEKIPELLEKVEREAPVYLGVVRDYLNHLYKEWWPVIREHLITAWNFLSENVPIVWNKVRETALLVAHKIYNLAPEFFSSVGAWFENLGEKISEKLPGVVAVVQEYAVIAGNLAKNFLTSVAEWLKTVADSSESTDDEPPQAAPPVSKPDHAVPK